MAAVEADADVREVADADDLGQMRGRGGFVLDVFKQKLDTEGSTEGFEVLDGGDCVLEHALVPVAVAVADVEDEELVGQDLGGFERALHLIHAVDAAGFFVVHDIHRGQAAAAHLRVGVERSVQRVGLHVGGFEPVGDLFGVLAAGVVEVLLGGKTSMA